MRATSQQQEGVQGYACLHASVYPQIDQASKLLWTCITVNSCKILTAVNRGLRAQEDQVLRDPLGYLKGMILKATLKIIIFTSKFERDDFFFSIKSERGNFSSKIHRVESERRG